MVQTIALFNNAQVYKVVSVFSLSEREKNSSGQFDVAGTSLALAVCSGSSHRLPGSAVTEKVKGSVKADRQWHWGHFGERSPVSGDSLQLTVSSFI